MSAQLAIIYAFAASAALFAFLSFKLNDSDQTLMQMLGVVFFGVTLAFIQFLIFGALQIADNEGLGYLVDGILPFITVTVWMNIIFIVLLFFKVMLYIVRTLWVFISNRTSTGRGSDRTRIKR